MLHQPFECINSQCIIEEIRKKITGQPHITATQVILTNLRYIYNSPGINKKSNGHQKCAVLNGRSMIKEFANDLIWSLFCQHVTTCIWSNVRPEPRTTIKYIRTKVNKYIAVKP